MKSNELWMEVCFYVLTKHPKHPDKQKLAAGKFKGLTGKWPNREWNIDTDTANVQLREPDKAVADTIDRQYEEWKAANGKKKTSTRVTKPAVRKTCRIGNSGKEMDGYEVWMDVCAHVKNTLHQEHRWHKVASGKFKGLTGQWPDRAWGYADKIDTTNRQVSAAVVSELDRQYAEWKAKNSGFTPKPATTHNDDDDFEF